MSEQEDLHKFLITAARSIHTHAHKRHRHNQDIWRKTAELLEASRRKITVDAEGVVEGIPEGIKGEVLQVLKEIALHPENANQLVEADITDEKLFKNICFRDATYALLATLYSKISGERSYLKKEDFAEMCPLFTNEPFDHYNHTQRKLGVWDTMETLVKHREHPLIEKSRTKPQVYNLTQKGLQYCYFLFRDSSVTFPGLHPERYFVTSDGHVHVKPKSSSSLNGDQNKTGPPVCMDRRLVEGDEMTLRTACKNRYSSQDVAVSTVVLFDLTCGESDERTRENLGGDSSSSSSSSDSKRSSISSSIRSDHNIPSIPTVVIDLVEDGLFDCRQEAIAPRMHEDVAVSDRGPSPRCPVRSPVKKRPRVWESERTNQDVVTANIDIDKVEASPPSSSAVAANAETVGMKGSTAYIAMDKIAFYDPQSVSRRWEVYRQSLWDTAVLRHSAKRSALLIMDLRERTKQSYYRSFFFDMKEKVKTYVPGVETKEISLQAGDFAIAFRGGDCAEDILLSDVVLERKTIDDIVSRSAGTSSSRCATADHMTQERKLRYCGLKHACMLLEGDIRTVKKVRGPRSTKDTDLENPDVISEPEDLVNYIASVIARNVGPHRVRILQTKNSGHTIVLLSAMTALVRRGRPGVSASSSIESTHGISLPTKASFDKFYHGWGAERLGREAAFRGDLRSAEVSSELTERLVRRFGAWEPLLAVLAICYANGEDETVAARKCELLLHGLDIGGTNISKQRLTTAYTFEHEREVADGMESVDCSRVWEHALVVNGRNESCYLLPFGVERGVHAVASAPLPDVGTVEMQSSKSTYVWMSENAVGKIVDDPELFPPHFLFANFSTPSGNLTTSLVGACTGSSSSSSRSKRGPKKAAPECTQGNELAWLQLQSSSTTGGILRRSEGIAVVVISGLQVVEALCVALEQQDATESGDRAIGGEKTSEMRDCDVVRLALQILELSFPSSLSMPAQHASEGGAAKFPEVLQSQFVVVLEHLLLANGSTGAVGQLQKACQAADESGAVRLVLSRGMQDLRKSDAREIAARCPWLVYLLVASAALERGWQCFLSDNAAETKALVQALMHETHRQSLLVL